jgi:hypothetical protein
MIQQTALFPETKHIPQWLADYFHKANAGQYIGKQDFYFNLKPIILDKYAEFAGYDLQVINKPCHSCDGTGVYKKYGYDYETKRSYIYEREQCWSCNGTGIYMVKKISLKRYLLNGVIYHIPCYEIRPEPHKNEIKGYVAHDPIDSNEAYRAYLILLWQYNRNWFYSRMKQTVDERTGEIKRQLQDFLQSIIRKENLNDELPF